MDKGGQVIDHGKYIVVWRREKGQWKLHRDMYSSNTTAATAK
jgi:ketosteroid isomerase-like protein